MIINALNSGAQVFMADFEDATSPTWTNIVGGQANLMDAVRRTISYVQPDTRKQYTLNPTVATLMVRPRGFHLLERHFVVDEQPAPGMLFDFGMFLFHNAAALRAAGTGPYFYLPKMQSHLEARLWNEIFLYAQSALGIPRGTIKVTVLIETLPAAFEMDEILFELKDHIAGLNCGRWDYIFSSIKTLQDRLIVRAARSRAGHDGGAVPALLHAAAHQDVPSPRRARDGRHGRADSNQRRS